MNKKKYYELIEKYKKLVEEKDFNSGFYNCGEFEKCKIDLIEFISLSNRKLMADCFYRMKRRGFLNFERPVLEQEKNHKLRTLYEKISNEQQLSDEDYEDTYLKEVWFDFSAVDVVGIIVFLLVLFVVCILIE